MALTVNNFWGGETGGLEEFSATVGNPDGTEAVVVRSGDRSLKMDGASSQSADLPLFNEVADAGDDHIFGVAFRLAVGTTPSSRVFFINAQEGANAILSIGLATDGSIELVDDSGTTLDTIGSGSISIDTWYFLEVHFQHVTSGGTWEWFLDGVSQGSGTNGDFSAGGTLDTFNFAGNSTLDVSLYFDDFYWLSGALL